jgi:hypothetical protein
MPILFVSEQVATTIVIVAGNVIVAIISGIIAVLLNQLNKKQDAVNDTVTGFSVRLDGKLDELIKSKESTARAEGKQERRDEEKTEISSAIHERERIEDRNKS